MSASERLTDYARRWRVDVEEEFETESSALAYGRSDDRPVVLKVIRRGGDEWRAGEVLEAFGGRGCARVYEHEPGAMLIERITPGDQLSLRSLDGRDDEATEILATVIAAMSPGPVPASCPTVTEWAGGFDRYLAARDQQIPRALALDGQRVYGALCASQGTTRLLHGDFHHYNVLHDADRGWVAIDPKGVIGEAEYEIGAILRNPGEAPALFADPATIERRIATLSACLGLDAGRVLAWSFSQAVLSALWDIEDGFVITDSHPAMRVAATTRPLLAGTRWG